MRRVVGVVATGAVAACSRLPPPAHPTTAALYGDLQRLVTIQAAAGWDVDRLEYEDLLAPALMSLCRVPVERRRELAAWLADEIGRRGGAVDDAWRQAGKDLDRVGTLLELTRIDGLLALATASAADCPFWLEPDDAFAGRQISRDRWQVSVGGGGKGTVVRRDGQTDVNFGGAGRLLLGRTFGTTHGLYAGLELGGSASFPRDEVDGERGALKLALDLVTPIVYRHTLVNSYWEAEAGYLARTTEDEVGTFEHGLHLGVAVGGRATRARLFFPGAALGVSYERLGSGDDAATLLKIGLRVALDWDL
ncbi:MAG: hypothetical protein R2939_07070 [Kofleriaceae bacterium]